MMLVKSGPQSSSKLLDFGLARIALARDTTETLLTNPGTVAGALCYMAREQLEGKPADARSDIYAFGLLEEMLERTGTPQLCEACCSVGGRGAVAIGTGPALGDRSGCGACTGNTTSEKAHSSVVGRGRPRDRRNRGDDSAEATDFP